MGVSLSSVHSGFEPIDLQKDTANIGFSGIEVHLPDGTQLSIKCRVIPNLGSDLSKIVPGIAYKLLAIEYLFNSETRVLRILTRTTHIGNQPPGFIEIEDDLPSFGTP
jgi:hypothetical protein